MTRLSRERIRARKKLDEARGKIAQLNKMFPGAIDKLKGDWPQNTRDEVDAILGLNLAINATSQPASQPTTQPAGETLVRIVKEANPELRRLKDMIRQAKDDLNILKDVNHMKDAHPRVQALKARITKLEEDLAKAPETVERKIYETVVNNTGQGTPIRPQSDPLGLYAMSNVVGEYQRAQQEWELLQPEYEDLEKKYNEMTELMSNFYVVRERYDDILDKVAKEQRELNAWQDKFNTIQMNLSAEVANRRTHMNTVQAAQKEFLPSEPNLMKILIGAFVAAMGVGAALVFLMNFFDRTISTTDKAKEFFDLPVHGVIGEIVSKRQLRWRWFKKWVLTSTVMGILLGCVAIAAMSISLKLHYPDKFVEWQSAPLAFISEYGQHAVTSITTAITSSLQ